MKIKHSLNIIIIASIILILVLSYFFFFRIDLTSDKRYSISEQSKNLMTNVEEPIRITIYLDGDLNPGFQRLKKSTLEMIEELSVYTNKKPIIEFTNPSIAENQEQREKKYAEMETDGFTPTAVYEHDKEGKAIQKIIFPWLEMTYKTRKVQVCLLKNIRGNSGDENLNISIENLEFEITDGIRQLVNTEVKRIAYIEGHGELTESQTKDVDKSLCQYFQIDRGVLWGNPDILRNYKVVIIARPTKAFSESDKFIIDQYIMNGGRVLWLIDGVRISRENLSTIGISPVIEQDLNLNDQLFRYGIRINPVLLQDVQCASVPVNVAPAGSNPEFQPMPFYFAPLLLTSPEHPVTRNITEVRSEFCSGIDFVGDNKHAKYELLLATSDNTHILAAPTNIELSQKIKPGDKSYFNVGYVPVSVAMEGNFESVFANRMVPKGLPSNYPIIKRSMNTRQIVVASGGIIRNEISLKDSTTIPLGLDRYMNQQFGNKDFIQNAVLYLADDDGWMQLRNREMKLRLLNKRLVNDEKLLWQVVNVLTPLILLLIFGIVYQIIRKRKYTRI